MEMLNADNWLSWKRRMLGVLSELDLVQYIQVDAEEPKPKDSNAPTADENKAIKDWKDGERKTRTRLELSIGNSEMVHISGAYTAKDIWRQLTMVKESKGRSGVIAVRRTLYKMDAKDDTDLVEHIGSLRQLQEELYNMGSIIADEDFAMILLSSLPENWDQFTSSYLGSKSGDKTAVLTSHELIAIILDEERRQKRRTVEGEAAMKAKQAAASSSKNKKDIECFNCRKKGHVKADCWAEGGGKEGQGPKQKKGGGNRGKSNQTQDNVNETLGDVAYTSRSTGVEFSKDDWMLDSGTTSHICPNVDAFRNFEKISGSIEGVGSNPVKVLGRGTVVVNFDLGTKTVKHTLTDVLYIPDAANCLLSVSRIDETGGHVVFKQGKCITKVAASLALESFEGSYMHWMLKRSKIKPKRILLRPRKRLGTIGIDVTDTLE